MPSLQSGDVEIVGSNGGLDGFSGVVGGYADLPELVKAYRDAALLVTASRIGVSTRFCLMLATNSAPKLASVLTLASTMMVVRSMCSTLPCPDVHCVVMVVLFMGILSLNQFFCLSGKRSD